MATTTPESHPNLIIHVAEKTNSNSPAADIWSALDAAVSAIFPNQLFAISVYDEANGTTNGRVADDGLVDSRQDGCPCHDSQDYEVDLPEDVPGFLNRDRQALDLRVHRVDDGDDEVNVVTCQHDDVTIVKSQPKIWDQLFPLLEYLVSTGYSKRNYLLESSPDLFSQSIILDLCSRNRIPVLHRATEQV
ncbi:hypothetical protein FPRO03_12445 [Fusarium proliferatum]|nr:hypothetical protein FPRO03_12445 [Fusarium proliferatum]